jgi:hypothetical protein
LSFPRGWCPNNHQRAGPVIYIYMSYGHMYIRVTAGRTGLQKNSQEG